MSVPTHTTDHTAQALAAMLSVVADNDPAMMELVTILADLVQDAEDAIWEVLTEMPIAAAEGVQLDLWGLIVGKRRGGLTDAAYRRVLAAWQGAMRSQGRRDAIITAMRAAADPTSIKYLDLRHATYEVDLFVPAPPLSADLVAAAIEIAEVSAPSGVAYQVVVGDDTVPFLHDTPGQGHDDGLQVERIA
jgi:hypothetical protein